MTQPTYETPNFFRIYDHMHDNDHASEHFFDRDDNDYFSIEEQIALLKYSLTLKEKTQKKLKIHVLSVKEYLGILNQIIQNQIIELHNIDDYSRDQDLSQDDQRKKKNERSLDKLDKIIVIEQHIKYAQTLQQNAQQQINLTALIQTLQQTKMQLQSKQKKQPSTETTEALKKTLSPSCSVCGSKGGCSHHNHSHGHSH